MSKMWTRLLFVGMLFAPTSSQGDEQPAAFFLSGLKNGRDELRSGVFHARGRRVTKDPAAGDSNEANVEIFSAFDYSHGSLRFDRSEEMTVLTEKGGKVAAVRMESTKFIRTPEKTLYWHPGSRTVAVGLPHKEAPFLVRPFDVRIVGLGYWGHFSKDIPFDKVFGMYHGEPVSEVSANGSMHRITWVYGKDSSAERRLWIDEAQGYSPVRMEVRYDYQGVPSPSEPTCSSEATWKEVSGIWVPATFALEWRQRSGKSTSYELAFDWESVNESVPMSVFTEDGFELPTGTSVVNTQLGKPIIERIVGAPSIPLQQESGVQHGRGIAALAIMGALVFCLAGYVLYRGRRMRRN